MRPDETERIEYGVVLDDLGSTDVYNSEDEARAAHPEPDALLVRIVTTWFP